MPATSTVAAVTLTSLNDTYTLGVGDHVIDGQGGNDTITVGAGDSIINVLDGNNTITAGAGDSTVTAGEGNNTITAGAGDSIVTAGDGDNTIATGAGDSIVTAGDGDNTVATGAGHNQVTTGAGKDIIATAAGDDVINAGGGTDIVTAGAGNDVLIYVAAENRTVITNDLYDGGSGFDTLQLVLTRAEWMRADIQADVANYLAFVAANTGGNGADSSASFTFSVFALTASKMEKLAVTVDGVVIDPANHAVTLGNDAVSTSENVVAVMVDVLANDAVPDLINSLTYSNPAHGSLQLAAAYSVTADVPSANFIYTPDAGFYDYLALGESATDTYTYTVTDATGDVKTATVTVTITGTNDAPVITAEVLSGAVTEQVTPAGNLTDNGTISFSDVDLTDVHLVSANGTSVGSNHGSLSAVLVADTTGSGLGGELNWTYTVADSAVEYLAAGQTRVESFTITLDDQNGSVTTKQIDVTITGTNDVPLISNDTSAQAGAVTEAGSLDTGAAVAGTLMATGTLTATDVDAGASQTWSIEGTPSATYGAIAIDAASGVWTYTLNNGLAATQALAENQTVTQSYTARVTDEFGAYVDQAVTVTINGTNDAPVAVNDTFNLPGLVAYYQFNDATNLGLDSSGHGNNLVAVGSNVTYTAAGEFGGGLALGGHGYLSTVNGLVPTGVPLGGQSYTISAWFETFGSPGGIIGWGNYGTQNQVNALRLGTGDESVWNYWWNHDIGPDAPVVYGKQFHNVAVTYDGSTRSMYFDGDLVGSQQTGGLDAKDGNFAVGKTFGNEYFTGVLDNVAVFNTALTAVQVQQQQRGDFAIEDTAVNIAGAALLANDTDVDAGDTKVLLSVQDASHGTVSLSAGTVTFTPDLNYSGAASFAYTMMDAAGAKSTATANFTIKAVNDAPVVAAALTSATNEGAASYGVDLLAGASDVDSGETTTLQVASVTYKIDSGAASGVAPGGLRLSGNTLTVDPTNAAFDSLAAGVNKVITVSYNVTDAHGATVAQTETITITGTNDVPVIGVQDLIGAVTEQVTPAGNLTDSGTISFTDVDLADTHSISAVTRVGSTLGTLTASVSTDTSHTTGLGGQVTWNYSVADAAVEYLAAGETRVETFSFNVLDNHGGSVPSTVSVTISGTNDAPTITSASTDAIGAVREDASTPTLTDSGTIVFNDIDLTDVHTTNVTAVAGNLLGGTLTMGAVSENAGTTVGSVGWTYNVANSATQYLAAGQVATEKFTVTVADGHGDTTSQVVAVTVTGTNDAPLVAAALTSAANEGAASYSVNLLSGASDVDTGDTATLQVANIAYKIDGGAASALVPSGLSLSGNTLTVDPRHAAFDSLAAGLQKVITVSYNVTDAHGATVAQTETITITGTNDAPVAINDIGSGSTITNATGNVLGNDTDVDSSSFTVTGIRTGSTEGSGTVSAPGAALAGAHGTLTLNANGNYSYAVNQSDAAVQALNVGAKLTDTFNYTMTDGSLSDKAVLAITIDGVNHAPVAVADSGTSINANGTVKVSFSPMGSAYASSASEYVITQNLNSQAGALWSNSKVSLGVSFSISAELFFGDNNGGADGFSFIIQNNSKTTIGASGGGIGYAGIPKSVGIEFDTYDNGAPMDISKDHAAFNTGGILNAIGGVINLGNIEDNQYHAVKIDWNAGSHVVTLSYGGKIIGSRTIDVVAEVGANEAYIGFAGSTGGFSNLQKIRNLDYQSVNNSVVLDVLVNDTDVDLGDKASLKVVAATSDHGATVSFSGVAGAGIAYSPGHAFDYLATNKIVIDTVTYIIEDSHGAQATSTVQVAISGVNGAPTIVKTVLGDEGNNPLSGSGLADYINGLGGNDILTGLAGNDLLTGGAGSDTFVFSQGGGADIITDFMAGVDVIDLSAFAGLGYASLADVSSHSTQTGADLIINMGGANSIQLTGVNLASLHAADFAFA